MRIAPKHFDLQLGFLSTQHENLNHVRCNHSCWRALSVVLFVVGMACDSNLDVTRTDAPVEFRSLGATGEFFQVQGTGGRSVEVELPLDRESTRWLLPATIRLARWNPARREFELFAQSRYDLGRRKVVGVAPGDGVYTALGLSNLAPLLNVQRHLHNIGKNSPLAYPPSWVDCKRILCEAFGDMWEEWSDSLQVNYSIMESPDSLEGTFGNLCDLCRLPLQSFDFAETDIFDFPDTDLDDCESVLFPCTDCDTDSDGLTDFEETCRYATDALSDDTDGDGLLDGWEILGYDSDGNGTLDVDLPSFGVDPLHKDLLVEMDWFFEDPDGDGVEDATEFSFRPKNAAIQGVVEAFAAAPIDNPDGTTGIHLIATFSNGIAEPDASISDLLAQQLSTGDFSGEFAVLKAIHMEEGMEAISRYCLWIRYGSGAGTGRTEQIPGDDFEISMGSQPTVGGTMRQQQGTFMHELGHTLGLYHSGVPGSGYLKNYEANYPSVMNYYHQTRGIVGTWTYDDPTVLQTTCHGSVPKKKEGDLVVTIGWLCFTAGVDTVMTYSSGGLPMIHEEHLDEEDGIPGVLSPVDWNLNGLIEPGIEVERNLQGDVYSSGVPVMDTMDDFDDWATVNLNLPVPP